MAIPIKVRGNFTTDPISPAEPWHIYRGHLENISQNLLTGAENAFLPNQLRFIVRDLVARNLTPVPESARNLRNAVHQMVHYQNNKCGEGSSGEHAALEPR